MVDVVNNDISLELLSAYLIRDAPAKLRQVISIPLKLSGVGTISASGPRPGSRSRQPRRQQSPANPPPCHSITRSACAATGYCSLTSGTVLPGEQLTACPVAGRRRISQNRKPRAAALNFGFATPTTPLALSPSPLQQSIFRLPVLSPNHCQHRFLSRVHLKSSQRDYHPSSIERSHYSPVLRPSLVHTWHIDELP